MSRQQEPLIGASWDNSSATVTDLHPHFLKNIMSRLLAPEGDGRSLLERLPFAFDDATGGTETELQAVVAGSRGDV